MVALKSLQTPKSVDFTARPKKMTAEEIEKRHREIAKRIPITLEILAR